MLIKIKGEASYWEKYLQGTYLIIQLVSRIM